MRGTPATCVLCELLHGFPFDTSWDRLQQVLQTTLYTLLMFHSYLT